jgi:DNA-binding PadR family transcriptional regulator
LQILAAERRRFLAARRMRREHRRMALLYRRTEAGRKAWDSEKSDVPLEYRRVLGLFVHDTDAREVRARLGWSEGALNDVLEELEEKGLLERYETDDRVDLDFTGSFSVAGLVPAARGRA